MELHRYHTEGVVLWKLVRQIVQHLLAQLQLQLFSIQAGRIIPAWGRGGSSLWVGEAVEHGGASEI